MQQMLELSSLLYLNRMENLININKDRTDMFSYNLLTLLSSLQIFDL
jgi:hypothetical protein